MNKALAPSAGQKLPALRPGEFRLVTGDITIEKAIGPDGQERRRFKTIMSSTIRDEGGDEIKPPAIQKMRDQFASGKTIFLNHRYVVPEDVFGTSDYAELKATGLRNESGAEVWDLHIAGNVNEPNPRAVQLADSIDGGYVRFGASIGGRVTKHKKNDAGGMDIWDIDTKEGSIVGIPMQQRAWVQKMASAALTLDDDNDGPQWYEDDQEETMPPKTAALDTEEGAALQVQGLDSEKAEKCESCGDPAGCDCTTCDCSASIHSSKSISADDLTVKTDEGVAEDETAPGGQEAPSEDATPETAPAEEDEEEEDSDAADQVSTEIANSFDPEDVVELARKARDMAIGINERDERIAALEAENVTLKAERDQLAEDKREAEEVIEKMLTPRAPRAQDHMTKSVRALPSILAPEIVNFLNKTEGDRQ